MKKIFSVLLLGTALTFSTACKKDEKKDDGKGDKAKDDKGAKGGDDKAGGDKAAGDDKAGGDDKAAAGGDSVGAPECDELIKKTRCMYDKTPGTPDTAKTAFDESVKMWTEALKNDATKAATIDACKMSLEGGKAGFEALGC